METIDQTGRDFYDLPSRVEAALKFALAVEPPFLADGLEVAGCACIERECVERVEAGEDADFYSVYWHIETGGCECFADFVTLNEARIFADVIHARFSFRNGIHDAT